MEESIAYDCRWSDELDDKFITDFRQVCSTVFNYDFTEKEFNRKFIDNIYGRSVLVVVYIDKKPSAARALWRNDICGTESYQPGDTCVLNICRGKGIFSEMTHRAMQMLPKDALIYNFPNRNSYKGYLKMGWKLIHTYNVQLLTSYKKYKIEHPIPIDDEYANWWIVNRQIYSFKFHNHYFLAHKDHRKFCYRILGEVSGTIAKKFERIRLGFFFYKSEKQTWYNRKFLKANVVSRCSDFEYIPVWKIDAI